MIVTRWITPTSTKYHATRRCPGIQASVQRGGWVAIPLRDHSGEFYTPCQSAVCRPVWRALHRHNDQIIRRAFMPRIHDELYRPSVLA